MCTSIWAFAQTQNEYIRISQIFLEQLKTQESTTETIDIISNWTRGELIECLVNDKQKLTFWINIYNGFIQQKLNNNPALYKDRSKFFKTNFIDIAERMMSFSDIEHGIIRHSQHEYGLGYITNPFAAKWEKDLRVKKKDWRVHFSLNCGAKSCPSVKIYDNTTLEIQLERSTLKFLEASSKASKENNKVTITPLFSWFRGDFGGMKGIKKILVSYDITNSEHVEIDFDKYDWTLYLYNFD